MQGEDKVDVWMPLYVGDFLTSTLGWSAEERGHYLTLLMAQWANGSLPSDPRALERVSPGVSSSWELLATKFEAGQDGRLRNPRLEEHRTAAIENRRSRIERSRAANQAKRSRSSKDTVEDSSKETYKETVEETAKASPSPSPSPSPSEINTTEAAPPSRTRPRAAGSATKASAISWSPADGWEGITDEDRREWLDAYPAAVLATELAKASAWLKANPKRGGRRNWRRFLVNWLSRCQDRGGTIREPGRRPDDRPPLKVDPDWPRKKREAEEREARRRLGPVALGEVINGKRGA